MTHHFFTSCQEMNLIRFGPASRKEGGVSYRKILPCRELRPYIAFYWLLEREADDVCEQDEISVRVIPDGCIDVVFVLDETVDEKAVDISQGRSFITLKDIPRIKLFGKGIRRLGIRFFPGGAFPFLKNPLADFRWRCESLQTAWGRSAIELEEELMGADTLTKKIHHLERRLIRVLREDNVKQPFIADLLTVIYERKGNLKTDDLAGIAAESPRNLRRKFEKWVGLSPKAFCRIVRFRSAMDELLSGIENDAAEVALDYGYYDQSHFSNEFKNFYGLTPYQVKHIIDASRQ